jgi:hypothetical protein
VNLDEWDGYAAESVADGYRCVGVCACCRHFKVSSVSTVNSGAGAETYLR